MKIEAAIFDVFGTCVDWRRGVAEAAAPVFAAKGIATDAHIFADAWRAEYQPAMETIRRDGRPYTPLDILHRENLERVLAAHDLATAFDDDEKAALNRAWEKLPPWPDTVPGLDALKRTLIIAPCSNASVALSTRLARFGGLPWDCILGAEIAQDYKPKPAVYRASAAALQLEPAQVLMVAAHNGDLAAARAEGFATAFVPRLTE
ncbi:MAG: haloacid dehalogenase type II, partial [Pseudomonadota bacterium]